MGELAKDKGMMHEIKTTRYGFKYGPAIVERTCDDKKWGVIISIKSDREVLELRVTPKGFIRIGTRRKALPFDKEIG